jgi:hypothetical protein
MDREVRREGLEYDLSTPGAVHRILYITATTSGFGGLEQGFSVLHTHVLEFSVKFRILTDKLEYRNLLLLEVRNSTQHTRVGVIRGSGPKAV